jgi:peptidoglycan/xylan/chitin deacetylase (PgdA/CDA1 family)
VKKRVALVAVTLSVLLLTVPAVAHAVSLPAKYRGKTIEGVKTTKKVIAFDFDDGPINSSKIIDIMERGGGKPTFFWVGSRITSTAAEYAVKHGIEINSHSWQHKDLPGTSAASMLSQINRTDARIAQFTGKKPLWFRAPNNDTNKSLLNLLASTGHLYAHQYKMTRDYDTKNVSAAALVKMFNKPKPGAIYLFHEGTPNTIKALPTIMRNLRLKGYKVVSNTELLKYGTPVTKFP